MNYNFSRVHNRRGFDSIKWAVKEVYGDNRGLGLSPRQLKHFMVRQAKVGLEDGMAFGPGGAGFQRINVACPRAILKQALQRIEKAANGTI